MEKDPIQLYELGVKLCKEGKYEQAIPILEQAESINTNGKYPDASNAKGLAFHFLQKYDLALASYEKAIDDSPNRIFLKAFNNKGATLIELRKFDEAIEIFKEALKESSPEERNQYRFNLGIAYKIIFRYDEALYYLSMVEDGGKKSEASFKVGEILRFQNKFEEAIKHYEKAEEYSDSGKYPMASLDKGGCLFQLGLLEEAYAALQKAEDDSIDNVYPMASCNKGAVLKLMGDPENAIIAFSKAEKDSPNGKYPDASFFKGQCFIQLNLISNAINSLKKAILDSKDQLFPSAHLKLAECYLGTNLKLSKEHGFIALSQDPRDPSIVSFIYSHFSSSITGLIYQNRIEYLHHLNTQSNENDLLQKHLDNFRLNHKIKEHDYSLFSCLLCCKTIEIPLDLDFISRLRLAYLINYSLGEAWRTFYIIDELIDREFDLDEIDYYFYLLSAYEIGEPVIELLSIINSYKKNPLGVFGSLLYNLGTQINSAITSNKYIDDYLLEIKITTANVDLSDIQYPSIIISSIRSILNQQPLTLDLQSWAIAGLFTQLLNTPVEIDELTLTRDNNSCWKNFQISLIQEELNYPHLIMNIRSAISSGVSYRLLLKQLFCAYQNTKSEKIKKNIAILQSATILSIQLDLEKIPFHKRSLVRNISSILIELSVDKAISSIFQTGIIFNMGLLIAIDHLMKLPLDILVQRDKENSDKIFEELIREIEKNNIQ